MRKASPDSHCVSNFATDRTLKKKIALEFNDGNVQQLRPETVADRTRLNIVLEYNLYQG